MLLMFTESEKQALGHYVYRLVDPRNGETFYVGQGVENRIFDHIQEAKNYSNRLSDTFKNTDETTTSLKLDRIVAIQNDGFEITYIIHRHKIPKEAVDHVEAAVIDAFPCLTNEKRGYKSADAGPMTVSQIRKKYGLEELIVPEDVRLLFININSLDNIYSQQKIIRQVECAWRLNPKRAEEANYVLAVFRGMVIGAFKNSTWVAATKARFPQLQADELDRYGFTPERINDIELDYFCGEVGVDGYRPGKLVPNSLSGSQNPIRYSY